MQEELLLLADGSDDEAAGVVGDGATAADAAAEADVEEVEVGRAIDAGVTVVLAARAGSSSVESLEEVGARVPCEGVG